MEILKQYRPPELHKEEQTELISVIVAAYNIEAYIERGVRSVCEQTYRNLEIIVVDDGSVDATGTILDKRGERRPFACEEYGDREGKGKLYRLCGRG